MELLNRIEIYIKYSLHYAIAIVLAFIVALATGVFSKAIGFIFMVLIIPCLYVKLHFNINNQLATLFTKRKFISVLPILMISILLMIVKIYTNESIKDYRGCFYAISETKMLLNYISYSFWSTIILWEIYYNILMRIFKKMIP